MNEGEAIIRLAAKGDGVTESGGHVPRAVPGDRLAADGSVMPGSHHVEPPCRHFDRCGGCQLQHADEATLATFVRSRVEGAARGQGIDVGEWLDTHLSPPLSRRRATLHAGRKGRSVMLGFREAGSHRIVDLAECPVLHPALFALAPPLREFVARHAGKGGVDIAMAQADQGVDVGLSNFELDGLVAMEDALAFAQTHRLARLTIDQGYGPEAVWEPDPVSVSLSGVPVAMPSGAFLQATADAERRMVGDACAWLAQDTLVADLFSGLGTFAFALSAESATARKVLAVEAERAAHLACKAASSGARGTIHALHRDLFRNPLQPAELDRFDAALIDPPRAGARAQIAQIAQSTLRRAVYISCNPSSWARDAAVLVEAGFRLSKVRPIGQFRWSTHVELASLFERD